MSEQSIDQKAESLAMNILGRLSSRKFLLTIAGVVALLVLQLSPEQIAAITTLITVFIGAEGARDFRAASQN